MPTLEEKIAGGIVGLLVGDALGVPYPVITHGHLRSQVCCALYCLWARYTAEELSGPWRERNPRMMANAFER